MYKIKNLFEHLVSLKISKIVVVCIGFLICTFLAYGWRMGLGKVTHSDELSLIFVGKDLLQGNIFLKDWHFSTGLFGLTTMELTLATLLFGYSDTIIYIISGLNYSLMILAAGVVVYKYARWIGVEKVFSYLFILIAIIIVPRSGTLLNAGTHVLGYAAAIFALYMTYSLAGKDIPRWGQALWVMLLGILSVTNSMFLYTVCIPLVLAGLYISYEERKRRVSPIAAYGIFSVICYMVFSKLWVICRGESLGGLDTVFVSREEIWNNIIVGICNILEVYGIDFWGENVVSAATFKAAIGFLILVKLSYEIYKFMKSKNRQGGRLVYLFLSMAVVNISAYVMSTLPSYSPEVNLIQPFLLGFSIAGILAWVHNARIEGAEKGNGIMIGLSVLLAIVMFPQFTLKQPDNTSRQQAAQYLTDYGYENGFADYWAAASVMYEAEGDVTIAPVISRSIIEIADDSNLVPFEFMSKKDWEQQRGNFLITGPFAEAQFGITDERILSTFGEWSDVKHFGDVTLYLWHEDKKMAD